jgi:hypothetical protein
MERGVPIPGQGGPLLNNPCPGTAREYAAST